MGFDRNEIGEKAKGGTEIARNSLEGMFDPAFLDHFQIISSRPRELKEDKIRVLFCHDLAQDPEVASLRDNNYRNKFHKLVFISNWQYQQYQLILGVPYSLQSLVIESGIQPATVNILGKPKDTINLVYTSTPQRGLSILVPVFEKLQELHKDIHLDVFSSFKIYGWEEADKQFEPLYEKCRSNPGITYHGFADHDTVLKRLEDCHIFAYPCIWQETSCRAMLESMSAGLLCVHPNFSGLTDTSGGLNMIYQGDSDLVIHANQFAGVLDTAINLIKSGDIVGRLRFNKSFVDGRFGMNSIKAQWEAQLKGLLNKYPDVASRKFAEDMFTYQM